MRSTGTRRCLLLLVTLALVCEPARAGQARVTSLGIVGFRNESSTQLSGQVVQAMASQLQKDLNDLHKDRLVARTLDAAADRTVDDLTALGRQQGVVFVVRGGLLSAGPTVQLYVDVINVENGRVSTLRAEGESSTLEAAASKAIRQLSQSIGELVAGVEAAPAQPVASLDVATAGASGEAERNEELWQLIAQADALLATPSSISPATLDALRGAVEALTSALQSKASTAAVSKNASEADRLIEIHRQELQSALDAASAEAAAERPEPELADEPSVQKKALLTSLGESLAQATSILRQIAELQAAWRATSDEQSAGTVVSPDTEEPVEELLEELTGAVTEEGEPIEGVTVTDSDSGETATTDANGSYVLRVVPGKPAILVLTRNGTRLSTAHVQVQRGRPAVADFELKPHSTSALQRSTRIAPSTVVVRSATAPSAASGRLEGVILDGQGRPVPRALVSLRRLAVARTDSQGRYRFAGVPAGQHELTIYRPGLKPQSSRVQIAPNRTSQTGARLEAGDRPVMRRSPAAASAGAGPLLRGLVNGPDRQPLTGARVTLMRSSGAVSVVTGATGRYAFRAIEPGAYRAVVSKYGYATEAESLTLRAGRTDTRNFTLRKDSTRATLPAVVPTRPSGAVAPAAPKPTGERADVRPSMNRRPAAVGGVRGRVIDGKTGRPVARAAVSLSGTASVQTDTAGSYGVNNLLPGPYQVVVKRSGYMDARANVIIRAGAIVSLEIRLTPRPSMQRRE